MSLQGQDIAKAGMQGPGTTLGVSAKETRRRIVVLIFAMLGCAVAGFVGVRPLTDSRQIKGGD